MIADRELPLSFIRHLESLESSYLAEDDPIGQSGFSGGPMRWRSEREPILEAIETDGEFLDIGCANGFLLECLIKWGRERGFALIPHGLDFSAKLIELAKKRLPEYSSNFYVGNAWDWKPPKEFQYVYTLYDCVPMEFLEEYVHRLLSRVVSVKGRLIIGAYGSQSERIPPFDIGSFLRSKDSSVVGTAQGGNLPITSFAWIDK